MKFIRFVAPEEDTEGVRYQYAESYIPFSHITGIGQYRNDPDKCVVTSATIFWIVGVSAKQFALEMQKTAKTIISYNCLST